MGRFQFLSLCFLLQLLLQCTESFDIQAFNFDRILVVEGTITNELKQQVVKLSRSIPLDATVPDIEENADVQVVDTDGQAFQFSFDPATGVYRSDVAFAARPESAYTLIINTQDGRVYTSSEVVLPPIVPIARVYAEISSDAGANGIDIFVDSEEAPDEVRYFRYEYEETYKIKVPQPSHFTWAIEDYDVGSGLYEISLTRRKPETICYSSNYSTGILQSSTRELERNRIFRFPIQHIYRRNPILRERYSILAKQYVQSLQAHTFYQTLNDLGGQGSLLSEVQPGFPPGNISSSDNSDERVVGFFEASSVSTKRMYTNYKEFVFEFPPYFIACDRIRMFPYAEMIQKLEKEHFQIVDYEEQGPVKLYHLYKEQCTDCTTFSSNVKPAFWED